MKIGIFTDSYLPTPTGVAVSVETFRKSLESIGHRVYIFAPNFKEKNKEYRDEIERVKRFPSFFTTFRKDAPVVWPILKYNSREIWEMDLDIVHTMHFFTIGTLGLKVAKKFNLPLVHTYHTNYEDYVKSYAPIIAPISKRYLISRSRTYCNKCDLVISPSPSMAKKIKGYGITTPIKALPTGINLSDFNSPLSEDDFRDKYKIRKEGKLLLFVGRLGEEKNIKFLINAFEKVLKKVDSNLIFIGSGPSVEQYKQLVKDKRIEDKVYFLGFLPKEDVNNAYGACDVFAFPSITETQGIVIVEAMVSGLVPVAINRLGPSDIITDGVDGLLSPLNSNQFVDNLIKILNDKKLRDKISEGAKKTAKTYSQPEVTKRLLDLYSEAKTNNGRDYN